MTCPYNNSVTNEQFRKVPCPGNPFGDDVLCGQCERDLDGDSDPDPLNTRGVNDGRAE